MKLFIYLLLQILIFMPIASFAAEGNSNSLVQKQKTEVTATQKAEAIKTYGKLPLYFIENNGQVDEQVSFYERGAGHATFFTRDGVVLSLSKGDGKVESPIHTADIKGLDAGKNKKITTEAVQLSFVGANKNAKIIADEKMPGHINYFVGNDKTKWRSNIPTFGAVTYKDVYKNIDIKFYGNNKNIEHDVIVKPGGDPSQVKFVYKGIKGLKVTDTGDLEVSLENGKIIEKRPVVFQEINGKRVAVSGSYRILKERDGTFAYGFKVASYDNTKDLVLDPVLVYSSYLGGYGGIENGIHIAVDTTGAAYITGLTQSGTFPLMNPIQNVTRGGDDVFVTKINPAGSAIVYSTYLGGSSGETGYGIAVDTTGAAYITGTTTSPDFPLMNPIQGVVNGWQSEAFVTKINPAGSAIVYSTYLGGSSGEAGFGIALDTTGAAYITGRTGSLDFPLMNPIQGANGGSYDAFVTKINPAGSAIVYSTYLGGSSGETGYGIAVDTTGAAYITGNTNSPDFPLMNPIQGSIGSLDDAFVTKVNSAGSAIVYSTYLGGSNGDTGRGIAVDTTGAAYITGYTYSTDFPLMTPIQGAFGGGIRADAFVTKTNSAGTAIVYSSYLGGNSDDLGYGIAVDTTGAAYITGITTSPDFPLMNPIQGTDLYDAFVTKMDPSGTVLVYSTYLGGSSFDNGYGIAVDTTGAAYITGTTSSLDFPLMNPIQGIIHGPPDTFISKIGLNKNAPIANAGPDQNIFLTETAYLDGSASSDPNGDPIVSYTWAIDSAPPGSTSVLINANTATPFLTPDLPGRYFISLVVNDGKINSTPDTIIISVIENMPPVAVAIGAPTTGLAPLTVNFDASGSNDPEGGMLSYSWDFGDTTTGTGVNPSHTYTTENYFTATVSVTDDFGLIAQASVVISTVPNQPPTVAPTATLINELAPVVQFIANGSDPEGGVLTYSWDFGDGGTSSLANPLHTYTTSGPFTATVTVTDNLGLTAQASVSIFVPNQPPTMNPTASPTSGQAPLDVQFTANANDPEGGVLTYLWDFGDGATSTLANPRHIYTTAGTFIISLTVSDNAWITGTSLGITVLNQPPVVIPTALPINGPAPLNVQFTANGSDPDGTIQTYLWDFGDGASSTLANPLHTYTTVGTFTATVTVTDNFGLTAQASVVITVINQPPIVAPTASPVNGLVPLDVQFTANGSDPDGNPLTYLWDFGDAASSTLANPLHTYTNPGTYVATVSVSDGEFTVTGSVTISVTPRDVMLSLSPDVTSIARGSTLGYTVTATNTTAVQQCFDYWETVTLPNGSTYPATGALFGPINICLNAGASKSAHLTHGVPMSAPVGSYIFNAFVGTHPTPIISNAHFNFNVTAFNLATKHPQRSWRLLENGFKR